MVSSLTLGHAAMLHLNHLFMGYGASINVFQWSLDMPPASVVCKQRTLYHSSHEHIFETIPHNMSDGNLPHQVPLFIKDISGEVVCIEGLAQNIVNIIHE
jgi:hypothetical protein